MIDAAELETKWQECEEIVKRYRSFAVAGQFAAAVMHEINGPLEAVGNLNYLIQHDVDDAERVRGYSKLIDEQLIMLTQLSRQTLSYFRPVETKEPVAIATLVEAALRVHQSKIHAKHIRLCRSLPTDVKAEVHAGDLLQVLSNLVANAVDAMPENGTLHFRVKRCTEEVRITVADNGHGIPDPIRARIFDPYFTTKRERGTGLGLAISKAIVEKHHGRIRTRTSTRAPKSGTIFRISLPSSYPAPLQT